MLMQWLSQGTLVGCLTWLIGHGVAIAQLVPDNTLGLERSSVTSLDAENLQISGGVARGSNLFHSFETFSIETGQGVYFTNPINVETILTRVTGENVSDIDGTLGVLGNADLFLLNPNGIVFGPNAKLDIQGSFLATTATEFTLPNGESFNAITPEAPPLLILNVPAGVQFGREYQGDINSTGRLTAGENLTLLGNQLYLEGQLIAGHDINLQAQGLLTIRDTAMDAFIARAGNDLTIQGDQGIDILALQHLEHTPFISGGNLSLISDGVISGDAHFESGGTFSVERISGGIAEFVSLHDPIISTAGNVDIAANYRGASLLIESQGDIQVQGNISITDPDEVSSFTGEDSILSSQPGLIIRSGQARLVYSEDSLSPLSPPFKTGTIPAGITLLGNVVTNGGPVNLNAPLGGIESQNITTRGGAITILSNLGDIITHGRLNSSSFSINENIGNGGNISISSSSGDIINHGQLLARSLSNEADSGTGGVIFISSDLGNVINHDRLDTSSISTNGNAGNGGTISIFSSSGDVINHDGLFASSRSTNGNTGNGGTISIFSSSGDVINYDGLFASSRSTNGNTGDGGVISISSDSGNITNNSWLNSASRSTNGNTGNGGNISIVSSSGNIINRSVNSSNHRLDTTSLSIEGNTGNGGNISISSNSGTIINYQSLNSSSFSQRGNTGRGGDIFISSNSGTIINHNNLFASSQSTEVDAGSGGDISMISVSGDIINHDRLFTSSQSTEADAGNGGDIFIHSDSGNIINHDWLFSNSLSVNGDAGNGGIISLSSISGKIINYDWLGSSSRSTNGDAGNGGNIFISSVSGETIHISGLNAISLSNYGNTGNGGSIYITTEAGSIIGDDATLLAFSVSESGLLTGNGGDVSLSARTDVSGLSILSLASAGDSGSVNIEGLGDLVISDVELVTTGQVDVVTLDTRSVTPNRPTTTRLISLDLEELRLGQSGNVDIIGQGDITFNKVDIQADANGSRPAGNVTVTSPGQITFNNSQINSNANSEGDAGDIVFVSLGEITFNNSELRTNANSEGDAGNIELTANWLTLDGGSAITATTAAGVDGGNLTFSLGNLLLLRNGSTISTTAGTNGAGGNGGNIVIEIPDGFIVAVPSENSDITANAFEGNGGRVEIEAVQLLGIEVRPRLTSLSDITASSEQGTPGIVASNLSGITPLQEVASLPNIRGAEAIAQGCQASSSQTSEFFNTGRGGLATSPGESLSAEDVWRDLRLPAENLPNHLSASPDTLVEATGWMLNATGIVEFVTRTSTERNCASNQSLEITQSTHQSTHK